MAAHYSIDESRFTDSGRSLNKQPVKLAIHFSYILSETEADP